MKRITIDGLTYICNVSHAEDIEFWSCANAKKVAQHLEKNGAVILSIDCTDVPNRIQVKHDVYKFKGETYLLTQCEGNIFEWAEQTLEGDFTYYYDMVVFNTDEGLVAAYRDDITNTIKI
jgi:hypothetical protein